MPLKRYLHCPHFCVKLINMKLTKKFLEEQKKKLEVEKDNLKHGLEKFASPDPQNRGNWKTKFPDFGIRTADPSEEEDQVEEYEATLPVEHSFESRIQNIDAALERIAKKTYGICLDCHKMITIKRLKAYPEASLCIKCTKTKS